MKLNLNGYDAVNYERRAISKKIDEDVSAFIAYDESDRYRESDFDGDSITKFIRDSFN